jgi:CubicO group peptidase (beta-lactamase class C family)
MKHIVNTTLLLLAHLLSLPPVYANQQIHTTNPSHAPQNSSDTVQHQVPQTQLDQVVQSYLKQGIALPGVAIVITDAERVLYEHYSGYAHIEQQQPVNANTQFYLKSSSKSFLGLLAARLHHEQVIDLQAPIKNYLPELQLPQPLDAQRISLQSHFTHTIPYHDSGLAYRTAFPGNLLSEQFVSHINNFARPRDIEFRYSNFGPIVGALAMEQATGQTWQHLIEQRIFKPLGMLNSHASISGSKQLSQAYIGAESGHYTPTALKADAQMHAAGGTVSSAQDLARWLQAQLTLGQLDGEQKIPRRAYTLSQAPLVALDWDFLDFHRYAHGLGMYRADYDGDVVLHHFGGETHLSHMPDQGFGIAILTNEVRFGSQITHRLATSLYDVLLNKSEAQQRVLEQVQTIRDQAHRLQQRLDQSSAAPAAQDWSNTLSASQLSGQYDNPRLGPIHIHNHGQGLMASFGALSAPLVNIQQDHYRVALAPWGGEPYAFTFSLQDQSIILDWGGRRFEKARLGTPATP